MYNLEKNKSKNKIYKTDKILINSINNIYKKKWKKDGDKINNDYYKWYKHYRNQFMHILHLTNFSKDITLFDCGLSPISITTLV